MPIQLTPEQRQFERTLTARECQRAIYLDFEGFENAPPTLVGFCFDGRFEQVIFDRTLKSAASAKRLAVKDGSTSIARLRDRAVRESRRIVAFSQFDKNQAFDHFGVDLRPVYADARLIARRWLNRLKASDPNWRQTNPEWDIDLTLKEFFKLTGYRRPAHLGVQQTTQRIRSVKDQIVKRGSFEKLTPVAKAKWTKLLDHNAHDVRGLMSLTEKALSRFVPM